MNTLPILNPIRKFDERVSLLPSSNNFGSGHAGLRCRKYLGFVSLLLLSASLSLGQTPIQKSAGKSLAQTSALLFSQLTDYQSAYGPCELWAPAGTNSEVADDFDVIGNIDRVYASGYVQNAGSFQGVHVRFYEYLPNGTPGALQREYFLTTGYNAGEIDVPLSPPFAATGKHFLSVQPVMQGWSWWSANTNAPHGQTFYLRDVAAGQTLWHHDTSAFYPNADLTFSLYGTVTAAGQISSLSADTLARSGYLEISGSNFDSGGQVLIDGISAFVANWQSTRIVAYVPEAARLTAVPVRVVNTSGLPSNIANLTVTTRQAAGHVNWRFQMNGPYSFARPAIAADGTTYSIDAFAHLYAIAPDGGLKWLAQGAGDKGVAVGADGVVYVASESAIKAFNPDGSVKWTFVQNPRAFICLGVSVGPDGNVYSVGTEGMGVFSLTPAGILRWTNPEPYNRLIVDSAEIVFGPNGNRQQLYFYANDHLRAVDLDGTSVFTIHPGGLAQLKPGQQPVVAPDGSVHTVLNDYTPSGNLIWSFATPYSYNVFTPASIGSDGTHYFVQNLSQMLALNANGTQRWHLAVTDYLDGPIVDPLNLQLVVGSSETGDHAGFIKSASATDGHELWRVVLPIEDPTVWNPGVGIFGFNQFVNTRARFTTDGQTAYVVTATATGDNATSKSFVYSLNAGTAGASTPTSVVSRRIHGTAGAFDIDLPLTGNTGIECRSGGANSDYQAVFTFPTAVTLSGASVTHEVGMFGTVDGAPNISPDGRTVALNLTNVTNAQTIAMTLTGVNNGTTTNNVTVRMTVLTGDANANGVVNASDISQIKSQSGHTVTNLNFRDDVTADGQINASDIGLVKSRSGSGTAMIAQTPEGSGGGHQ